LKGGGGKAFFELMPHGYMAPYKTLDGADNAPYYDIITALTTAHTTPHTHAHHRHDMMM